MSTTTIIQKLNYARAERSAHVLTGTATNRIIAQTVPSAHVDMNVSSYHPPCISLLPRCMYLISLSFSLSLSLALFPPSVDCPVAHVPRFSYVGIWLGWRRRPSGAVFCYESSHNIFKWFPEVERTTTVVVCMIRNFGNTDVSLFFLGVSASRPCRAPVSRCKAVALRCPSPFSRGLRHLSRLISGLR